MKIKFLMYSVIISVSLTFSSFVQSKTLAMVIGIDEYDHQSTLHGAVNDAKDIQQALLSNAAKQENVYLLLNKQASKQRIQQTWQKMITDSKPGDTLLVTFAGHGGQIPDKDKDEADSLDEVFLLSGFQPARKVSEEEMISDDEWYRWFEAAVDRQVIFVADSCHSGTMHRSIALGKRFQQVSTAPAPKPKKNKDITPREEQTHVIFFAATTENLDSYEREIHGEARGALSYVFAKAIRGEADDGDGILKKQELDNYIHDNVVALTEDKNKQIPQVRPRGNAQLSLIKLDKPASQDGTAIPKAFDAYFKQGNTNRSGASVTFEIPNPTKPYLTIYNLTGDGKTQFLYPLPLQGDMPRIVTNKPFTLDFTATDVTGGEQLVAILSDAKLPKVHALLKSNHNQPSSKQFENDLSELLAHESFDSKRIEHKVVK